ncbi:MAG: hypothetical protein VXX85_02245 [Candidatus Margulisiibacteriota bacterium]|nr:hypothetical protein [Candidatus Margulisiibacteriota bacterium]
MNQGRPSLPNSVAGANAFGTNSGAENIAPLPEGWFLTKDPDSGSNYCYNAKNNKTYYIAHDDKGNQYYWNNEGTRWDLPPLKEADLNPTVSHINVECKAKNFSSLKITGLDNIVVSGMAHPVEHNPVTYKGDLDSLFRDVISHSDANSHPTLVSLDDRNLDAIEDSWKIVTNGGENSQLIVKDFNPPTVDQMVRLSEIVDKCNEDGNNLFIYCGEGFGRTGTMIASLILRQLINETNNASFEKSTTLDMPSEYSKVDSVKTTPIVAKAIQLSRINFAATSVEMAKQVAALEEYQNHLQLL